MKTLLKLNDLELVKNYREIVLLKSGSAVARFADDQLLSAIVSLLSLAHENDLNLSGSKIMANFQPDLF